MMDIRGREGSQIRDRVLGGALRGHFIARSRIRGWRHTPIALPCRPLKFKDDLDAPHLNAAEVLEYPRVGSRGYEYEYDYDYALSG